VAPDYALPRLPKHLNVTYRRLWDYNGKQVADITDVPADYVVIPMSTPRRSHSEKWRVAWVKNVDADAFLKDRGYEPVASFKTPLPAWGAEVPDIHVINPRVVIWKNVNGHPPVSSQAVPVRSN
jgi:hypothetical protein